MLTQIISNCGCCGVPCCTSTSAPLWNTYKSCYYTSTVQTYTLRELGFPYKNEDGIVNLKDFSCILELEDGFVYKWNLYITDNGSTQDIKGDIDGEGILMGLPTTVGLYCRYGSTLQLRCSKEAPTTTTTTTTTTK